MGSSWLLISHQTLAIFQRIALTLLIAALFLGTLYFLMGLRRGFQKNREAMIKCERALGNFRANGRDDVSLCKTVGAISNAVNPVFYVRNPVDSTEDLTSRLTDKQKSNFQDAISLFASDASDAIEEESREKASRIWRKQLGDRFPSIKFEKKEDEKEKDAAALGAFYVSRNPSKPWGGT